jgi:probable phosphoglycerate mutase
MPDGYVSHTEMRLYLIRHADPDYPNNTITPAGHIEAAALARRLAREGLTRIYCSPLGRAVHTMQYTAQATGLTPQIAPWIAELDEFRVPLPPPWPALMAWDVPGEMTRQDAAPATSDHWSSIPAFSMPVLREKLRWLGEQSDAFLAGLGYQREGRRYRAVSPNSQRIAMFCHNGFGLSWLGHLLEVPPPTMWSGFWLPPTSVTVILFDQRSAEWAVPRCLCVGDTSHLHAAGLPVTPAGIKANFD